MSLDTKNESTWCPGCPNFMLLAGAKKAIKSMISEGDKQEDFAMTTGIGCHAKIFDYLNISGVYGLHGRVLPTALGLKLGNPHLKVIGFAGDGDTYSEGISHFIHACRYNSDMTLIVHDNQAFSLTTGQSTPTSQQGYKNKATGPAGELNVPLNPIKVALASGASFVARCNARDIEHTAEIIEKAIKHKGFSFVEAIQSCLIFNLEMNDIDKLTHKINNGKDMPKALALADEWNYNSGKGKIPIGVIYEEKRDTLEEEWPQLKFLKDKKIGWKSFKK